MISLKIIPTCMLQDDVKRGRERLTMLLERAAKEERNNSMLAEKIFSWAIAQQEEIDALVSEIAKRS